MDTCTYLSYVPVGFSVAVFVVTLPFLVHLNVLDIIPVIITLLIILQ